MTEQSIPRRFEGRSVLVTGAGTGYGAEIAVRAAQEGAARVAVHYRSSAAGAEKTVARIREAGGEAFTVQADIAVHADVVRMADEVFG
ncbi:SDR family NAD(P)-dependent oxidoreductase, partial [Streptomyces scabiei]